MHSGEQLSLFTPSETARIKSGINMTPVSTVAQTRFTYIDLFSGIGGFRIAIDKMGGKCVGYSEIDKHCIETYVANYKDKNENNFGDITKVKSLPQVDLLVGGVPCQSWSVAGKMLGFDDPRGMLWHDVIRLLSSAKPKAFIFENVRGLYDPRNKHNLNFILDGFRDVGYSVNAKILNSYDFGVPQIRERLFIVGFHNDYKLCNSNFFFPCGVAVHDNLAKYLDGIENRSIEKTKFKPDVLFGEYIPKSRNAFQKEDELNDFFTMCDTRNGHTTIHSWDIIETTTRQKDIMLAILKNRRRKKYGIRDGNPLSFDDIADIVSDLRESELDELVCKELLKKDNGKYTLSNSKNSSGINGVYRMYMPFSKIFSTLTASGTRDVVVTEYIDANVPPHEYRRVFIEKIVANRKYRPLTVVETQRIQGFPDSFKPHDNATIAKKQFGNAVSPPVIEALMLQVIETGVFNSYIDNKHYSYNTDVLKSADNIEMYVNL